MSWKLYWCIGTALASLTLAVVLLDMPLWLVLLVLVITACVFRGGANRVVHGSAMFQQVRQDSRHQIVRWITAAAAVHVLWGVVFHLRPELWPLWTVGLAALVGLEVAIARAHEYMLTQLAHQPNAGSLRRAEVEPTQRPVTIAEAALSRSGHDHLTVTGWETVNQGDRPVGVRYNLRVPSRSNKTGAITLGGKDVEPIAIAFSELLGHDLESDWVHVTKKPGAGRYTLAVLTCDVMATIHPYIDPPGWRSINDPCVIGYSIDGTAYAIPLCQHQADTGKSRFGKSGLLQVKLAHVTASHDAVAWVCGVEKLYDLVGPWIAPYMDTGKRIPLDWIATGIEDTLRMLVTAMTIARWRQRQPHHLRGDFKKIVLIVEEASFALSINKVRATYDGRSMTASQLVEAITKGAGSAGVHIVVVSQRGTNDNWGDCGGNINANIGAQTVFCTADDAEVGRATGDWKLSVPRHPGEYWLQPGNGDPVIKLKAPYIQETDPQRRKLHDGLTVEDVAWARRDYVVDLDEGSARAAGEAYANRHQYADAELMGYLTGEHAVPVSSDESTAESQMDAALDKIFAAAGVEFPQQPTETTPDAAGGVATMVGRRSRADRILDIVVAANAPLRTAEILDALRGSAVDHNDTEQVVANALGKLVADGRLMRPERGLYQAC